MKLIDQRAAVRELTGIGMQVARSKMHTVARCISAVELLPAVDAVEVVRCRDCVHYGPGKRFGGENFCQRLPLYAEQGGLNMPDDGFCSRGERKGEANGTTDI